MMVVSSFSDLEADGSIEEMVFIVATPSSDCSAGYEHLFVFTGVQ